MPSRWVRGCRRFVPDRLRRSAFDPTVADLDRERTDRAHGRRAGARVVTRLRFNLAVLVAAIECRRLAVREAVDPDPRADAHGGGFLATVPNLRGALRVFTRSPALASVVVITLAVGIGGNLAIFSIVNQFLLAPLPVPDPGRLVRVFGVSPDGEGGDIVSYPNYRDLRDGSTSVDLAAHAQPVARLGPLDAGEIRTVELVSGNYFRVLGLAPLRGRLIDDRDDGIEGARAVVVIGAGYWRSRYGSSESAVGQTLLVNSTPFEIIGVGPDGYHGTYNARLVDAWAPLAMQQQVRPQGLTLDRRGWGWLSMIGRLRPGADLRSVQREAEVVAAGIGRRFPGRDGGAARFAVKPASSMGEADRRMFEPALSAAFAFTVLLLVVTCANLAGVMQTRLVARRRELGIRRSLGASRGRLIAEWMSESLALALAGGTLGLAGARVVGLWLSSVKLPAELVGDLTIDPALDWRVAAYAAAISLAAGLLFGVIPAIRAGHVPPMSVLKDEGGASGPAGNRLRRAMVLIQVTVSVVLLVSSGLLASSLGHQRAFNPGFDTSHLGLLAFDLRRQGLAKPEWRDATDRILARVRQQPGVIQADIATTVPLAPGQDRMGFVIPGYVPPNGKTYVSIDYNVVGAAYLDALGVSFVRGGTWTPGAGPPAVVVNETMARRFWPGADPVGKTIKIAGGGPDVTIAGVVHDTVYYEVGEAPRPFVFLPADAQPPASFIVVIRTMGDPAPMLRDLARATAASDRRVAAFLQMTFDEARGVSLFPMRMLAGATVAFGAIAIVLTAVGLYGVVSTTVGQRTREIGIRMALGARSVTVLGGVLREAIVIAGAGAAMGLLLGYWSAGPLRGWLFGVGRFDAGVYFGVAAVVVAIALVAAAVPARRASKVDPVMALRH